MANENLYTLLGFIPATESWEMPPALEAAARALVRSGKLRINADAERNFVRHGLSDWDATFTARELNEPALLAKTRALLRKHVPGALGDQGVEDLLMHLRRELVKARGVSPEKELKVARVLVQSADFSVIQLLLQSGTEIFVSYSHNVGDLLAVHAWQQHGLSGGLQATLESGTQVFISCAGDPFFQGEQKTFVTDGWPALARMVVIGAQELGHFADLIRRGGQIVGRYSLQPEARAARRADIAHLARLREQCLQAGLQRLLRIEAQVRFYGKRRRLTLIWWFWQARRLVACARYRARLNSNSIHLKFKTYPAHYYGEAWRLFLDDMAFNLSPQAEAYRHPNPEIEEQIACIEAVARVPQQQKKWGISAVSLAWPGLSPVYEAILATHRQAMGSAPDHHNISFIQLLTARARRRFRPRPGYYPASR